MDHLEKLFRKTKRRVIGLMSGTSADGIDAVLVEITGSGSRTSVRQIAFQTYPFPAGFKKFCHRNSNPSTARLDEITRLDMLVAQLFADAAKRITRKAGYKMDDIDLIGSHGQTIQHLPVPMKLFGKSIRASLQIGNPSVIAKQTGVTTVGDFRAGDVALGGSGAPLVPYFDYLFFRSSRVHRLLLNIGGIANMTVLQKSCTPEKVIAFDTGPGNMVVDGLMQRLYDEPFDRNGLVALRGKLSPSVLRWLMSHRYLRGKPPKSTGREVFGKEFLERVLSKGKRERKEDLIATATEFTAVTVYDSYLRFIRGTTTIDEVLVSGGGVHNIYMMNALRRYFNGVRVQSLGETGFSADAKEAVCFAVLANETIAGNPGNIPAVTGASAATRLGVICLP